jgi:hypothetical protein
MTTLSTQRIKRFFISIAAQKDLSLDSFFEALEASDDHSVTLEIDVIVDKFNEILKTRKR